MTANNLLNTINVRIDALKVSEATTFVELASISRELLLYVPDTGDIGTINRLLNVLTRHNREGFILYIKEFLEWKFDDKKKAFTDKIVGKETKSKIATNRNTFLANETNNYWTWAERNIDKMKRKQDFKKRITNAVNAALEGDETNDPLMAMDVIKAILDGGIDVTDLILHIVSSGFDVTEHVETPDVEEGEAKELPQLPAPVKTEKKAKPPVTKKKAA